MNNCISNSFVHVVLESNTYEKNLILLILFGRGENSILHRICEIEFYLRIFSLDKSLLHLVVCKLKPLETKYIRSIRVTGISMRCIISAAHSQQKSIRIALDFNSLLRF